MSPYKAVIAVLVMATVTYITRALPLTFFRKQIRSHWLQSFLYYVPYAVLGAMVFPTILYSTGNVQTAVVGFIVAMVLAFLEKDLLVVAIGGVLAAYMAGRLGL